MSGWTKNNVNEYCLNCGTKLLDLYCHHCGQKDTPRRQTLSELIKTYLGLFLSFESNFLRKAGLLLFKPGFLPKEYTAGKRESYYNPAQAYGFISFVFFLLLFSLSDSDKMSVKVSANEKEIIEFNGEMQGLREGFNQAKVKYKSVDEYDSVQKTLPSKMRDGWLTRKMNIRTIKLDEKYKDDITGNRLTTDFAKSFNDNFSKVLFCLLPIFALLLKALYFRKDFYYSEHLIFTLFYYNYFYLAAILNLLLNYIPLIGVYLKTGVIIWMLIYLLIAMKQMYEQSWRKTALKYFLFMFAFSFCLLLGVAANFLISLLYL
jgi:hypothetical protein